ncbi:ATP-binding protein [Streptomyces oryzae]|uniref:ATP-binding protein n=1 Tax=Streptomyces oryzae TaxID=1434886 RepID=A0ABS3XJV2_9ACTN|nr:ATP-binding protein [Streptomyces oryzae]
MSIVQGWRADLSDQRIDDLRLLVSEVFTNALEHACGAYAVCVEQTEERIRVEVTDAATDLPAMRNGDLDAESGRGIFLVSVLADAWGIRPIDAGKVVWFELHLGGEESRQSAGAKTVHG